MRYPKQLLAGLAALLLLGGPAHATEFPAKPVHFITQFPAGSGPDVVLRTMAPKLQKQWGKPVVIENKPGGNGFIAINALKEAAPDGHTLLLIDSMNLTGYPHLFKKLPYDPITDFTPLTPMFRATFFLMVPAGSNYQAVSDLLADARARPGELNYGSWSVGNPAHLGTSTLLARTGTDMQHVIYSNAMTLYTAVASQELDFALGTLATLATFPDRLRALAVTGTRRHELAPQVPTLEEAGGPGGLESFGWSLIVAPKGLPAETADQIKHDFDAVLDDPEVREIFRVNGYDRFLIDRADLPAFIAAESGDMAGVIEQARISLQ